MTDAANLSPGSADECAKIISDAHKSGAQIEILGNGTKSNIGHAVDADIKLSTSKLAGIVEYTPTELVMTARAGTKLSDIKKTLDKNNQMLAFDPPNYASLLGIKGHQTIGGVLATNIAGSRRLSAGAARDGLLGVKFINGKGEQIKTGGKVMKNVTGLDLVKLMAGSWGTLGLMTEVTFKVLPKPETASTIIIEGLSDADASKAMIMAMAQSADVACASHIPHNLVGTLLDGTMSAKAATMFRIEGLKASVQLRTKKLISALEPFGHIEQIEHKQSQTLWNDVGNVLPFATIKDRDIWKISVPPTAGHQLVVLIKKTYEASAFYDWQGGLVWLAVAPEMSAPYLREQIAALGGGHALLIRPVQDASMKLEIFQPQPAPLAALSARIKQKLDPKMIFNPGRMYGAEIKGSAQLEAAS